MPLSQNKNCIKAAGKRVLAEDGPGQGMPVAPHEGDFDSHQ